MKIPIKAEPLIGTPNLTFSRWLPIGRDQGIQLEEDGIELLLWFDLQSTWWASQPQAEDLKNHVNVLAHYIWAEVTVRNIDNALAAHIRTFDYKRDLLPSEKALQKKYEDVGWRVLRIVVHRYNRLIEFARSIKNQFWLQPYEQDRNSMYSQFQHFEATASINQGKTFRFQPTNRMAINVIMRSEDEYIRKDEWGDVIAFVRNDHKAPLVNEVLATAEQLVGNGYDRSALMEAVAALEVAVAKFGRKHKKNPDLASKYGARLGVADLDKQIDHMGLSGTIRYLLPLLLPEEVLPEETLSGCRKAIEQRQNVVHNGQRSVSGVTKFIRSIRQCCKVLNEYQ
ncbi:hypothetical protein SAMN06295888_10581 [Desulfonatronum zhilinae]|nr:hypothetical protein SAMN06295888_10581 [Desulfonatronum zhilinae]